MLENREILMERANNGDTNAMLELGFYELFVNKNYDNSFVWFKKAYENGNRKAAFGLVITCSETNNKAMYYWANIVLKNFGDNFSEEIDNYQLWSCTAVNYKRERKKFGANYSVFTNVSNPKEKQLEIGVGFDQNSNKSYYRNVVIKFKDLEENKYIYDEDIEQELNGICLYDESEKVISMIEKIYKETNYPGALYLLGEIYCYGYCGLCINEEKGIEYFEAAAQEGYMRANTTLSTIYLQKASRYLYKAYDHYDDTNAYEKLYAGNCMIADYLIGNVATYYNQYDQYFEGLEKIVKASQEGCEEATLILNVLGKDKLTKRNYKKGLEKEKSKFLDYLYSYYEEDLLDYEDIEFKDIIENFDYKDIE